MIRLSTLWVLLFTLVACQKNSSEVSVSKDLRRDGIIGGTVVAKSEPAAGSTVALIQVIGGSTFDNCTGTVLSADLILTAAHCLMDKEKAIYVYAGTETRPDLQDSEVTAVQKSLEHPQFTKVALPGELGITTIHDVALLKLSKPLPSSIKPVPILANADKIQVGDQILLAGFGVIDDGTMESGNGLSQVTVKVADLIENFVITDQRQGRGACAGDSGGPAYLQTSEGLVVFGITRGPHKGAAHCHGYGEYTFATKYLDFIVEGAQRLGAKAPTLYEK